MDTDLDHGPAYGDTMSWPEQTKPDVELQLVHAQLDVDMHAFAKLFVQLMTAPTPHAILGHRRTGHRKIDICSRQSVARRELLQQQKMS